MQELIDSIWIEFEIEIELCSTKPPKTKHQQTNKQTIELNEGKTAQ